MALMTVDSKDPGDFAPRCRGGHAGFPGAESDSIVGWPEITS